MKKVFYIICMIAIVFSCAGCIQQASTEDIAKEFLTCIYTTNKEERYTTFESIDKSDNESLIVATDAYYSDFETLVNEEMLDELMSNRIPMKYNQFYLENPVTVESISISEGAGEKYDYMVTAKQNNEDVILTGIIGFDENLKISYFYERQ